MDPIDQRLSLLKKQLEERRCSDQILLDCGLFIPVMGLILGITLVNNTDAAHLIRWVFLFISIGCLGITRRIRHPILTPIIILLIFTLFGVLRMQHFQTTPPHDLFHSIPPNEVPVPLSVKGRIDSLPTQHHHHRKDHLSITTTFRLKTHQVRSETDWLPCTGTLQVYVSGAISPFNLGDKVLIYGLCSPLTGATNPGQFDFAKYMGRQNIRLQLQVKDPNSLLLEKTANPYSWSHLHTNVYLHAKQALLKHLPETSSQTGLLLALLLGERNQLTPQTQEAFAQTGLQHIISLSGLHVGIVVGLVWYLGRLCGLLKPKRALLCTLFLCYFVLIVPTRGPTLRAAIIGWSLCGAYLFHRRPSPWHSLALSAFILLLIRPTQLFEAGWQLSFACVASILILTNPLMDAFDRTTHSWTQPGAASYRSRRRLIRATVNLLMVGFSATLGGSGIVLAHFYTITPLAPLWTIMVFPIIALILPLGFIKILLSWIPGLAWVLAQILNFLASFLMVIVEGLTKFPLNTLTIGQTPTWHILGYYLILLGALLVWKKRYPQLNLKTVLRLSVGLLIYCIFPTFRHHQGLNLTCLDVGHGQALVIRHENQTWLFDAGSLYRRNVGRSIINPFLDYSGIHKLHAVALSHHDIDHIIGLPDVARHCRVQHFLANQTFQKRLTPASPLAPLFRDDKHTLKDINNSQQHLPPKTQILWPPSNAAQTSDNNASSVVLIHYAGKQILLCGDIETEAQTQLLALYPHLQPDILLAPHHGSLKTLAPEFITKLHPAIILCSCSYSQFLQKRVIIEQENAQVYLTARDGAITVRIHPNGECQVQTYKKSPHN